jgi:glutaredoxin
MGNLCASGAKIPVTNLEPLKRKSPAKEELRVWGDYFSSDTRTIIAILDYCGINYQFKEVDTFLGEHKEEEYMKVNPTCQIPTIEDGNNLLIGGFSTMIMFLASTKVDI